MTDSNLVCGYTTQDHLMLDLDRLGFYKAWHIVRMVQRDYPDVGMALLVHSSRWHYHVVYNNRIGWERIVKIIEDLAALGIVEPNYLNVRSFRRDLTLRVSAKHGEQRDRQVPEPVMLLNVQGRKDPFDGIKSYLKLLGAFRDLHGYLEIVLEALLYP